MATTWNRKIFDRAWNASSAPIDYLSSAQRSTMKQRAAAANESATQSALTGLSRTFGANSAAMATQGARLKASSGSRTAALMADVDIEAAEKEAELEGIRRSQMTSLAGLAQNMAESDRSYNLNLSELASSNALKEKQLELEEWRAKNNIVDQYEDQTGTRYYITATGKKIKASMSTAQRQLVASHKYY